MALYIKFENGRQIEVAEMSGIPGNDWKEAPANFSWEKQYKLDSGGNVKAMTQAQLEAEQLAMEKAARKEEVEAQANLFRAAIYPSGQSKNEEYTIKGEAARRIADLQAAGTEIKTDSVDYLVLDPEAKARGITISELVALISEKANAMKIAIGVIAAFEVKGEKVIDEATTVGDIESGLNALIEETKTALKIS